MRDTNWQVIVVGGGMSAVCAAISAAKAGAKTLIIERTGRLGGAATSNMVQPYMGWMAQEPALISDLLERCSGENAKLHDLVLAEAVLEAGATVLLHTWCLAPIMDGQRISGLRIVNKGGEQQLRSDCLIDASGDGDIAAAAGAPFDFGRPGDGLLQPMSIMYEVGGVAPEAFCCSCEESARNTEIGGTTWHAIVSAGLTRHELPETVGVIRLYPGAYPDRRIVNATQINHVNGLCAEDLTRAEIVCRQQARIVTAFLRHHAPGYEDCHISEMPAAVGVRETRRFHGIKTMNIATMRQGERLPDAVVQEVSFPVDIHNPDGVGQASGKDAASLPPYDIPYGCLVPLHHDGLLLAGRIISGTHEAHASYRVQRITMAIGRAAGTAAGLCALMTCQPRELPLEKLRSALGLGV